jgi:hypothetical protein
LAAGTDSFGPGRLTGAYVVAPAGAAMSRPATTNSPIKQVRKRLSIALNLPIIGAAWNDSKNRGARI